MIQEKINENLDQSKVQNDKMNYYWMVRFFCGFAAEEALLTNTPIDTAAIAPTLSYDHLQFIWQDCMMFNDEKNWINVSSCIGAIKSLVRASIN